MKEIDSNNIIGFEWDKGNIDKNYKKHDVAFWESEEIFSNQPLLVKSDKKHSTVGEIRYYALGQTNESRLLFISFTVRANKIRIISARPMNQKERNIYQNL